LHFSPLCNGIKISKLSQPSIWRHTAKTVIQMFCPTGI
jgi:hypothetical protein